MKIDNVNDASTLVHLIKDLIGTRDGILTLLFVVVIVSAGIVIRKDSKQIDLLREGNKELELKLTLADERNSKTLDECIEITQQYFNFFDKIGTKMSDKKNMIQSIERETDATIKHQKEIIKKRKNYDDEEDN